MVSPAEMPLLNPVARPLVDCTGVTVLSEVVAKLSEHLDREVVIVTNAHPRVRQCLVSLGLRFALVYPARHLKEAWLVRMAQLRLAAVLAGSAHDGKLEARLAEGEWDRILDGLEMQAHCRHYVLSSAVTCFHHVLFRVVADSDDVLLWYSRETVRTVL